MSAFTRTHSLHTPQDTEARSRILGGPLLDFPGLEDCLSGYELLGKQILGSGRAWGPSRPGIPRELSGHLQDRKVVLEVSEAFSIELTQGLPQGCAQKAVRSGIRPPACLHGKAMSGVCIYLAELSFFRSFCCAAKTKQQNEVPPAGRHP